MIHETPARKPSRHSRNSSASKQNRNQNESPADQSEVALVTEDWRLSQFWYDCETAETVANEILALCSGSPSRVACIACPTLYAYLKRIDPSVSVQLLEHDKRFEQYGSDFTFYDYNQPEELPTEMKHAYQVIVAEYMLTPFVMNHRVGSAWRKLLKQYLSSRSQMLTCFYLQEKFKEIKQRNFLVCIHAYSGLSIRASLGMNFAYSLTTIQGCDWEDGSKRNR